MPKSMVPIIGVVSARTIQELGELISREGEEFMLALAGSIIAHLEFYAPQSCITPFPLAVNRPRFIDVRCDGYLASEPKSEVAMVRNRRVNQPI